MLTRIVVAFVCGLALMLQSPQDYPTKPVSMIEPFGAGGGPDIIVRAVSPKLSELWGQPVTVENHPGAGAPPRGLYNFLPAHPTASFCPGSARPPADSNARFLLGLAAADGPGPTSSPTYCFFQR